MSPYRTIIKWITPSEARPVANELLNHAQRVRAISNKIKPIHSELDSTWSGGAKRKSLSKYDPLASDLNRFADSLESKAFSIAAISVWIEVKEWFDDIVKGKK